MRTQSFDSLSTRGTLWHFGSNSQWAKNSSNFSLKNFFSSIFSDFFLIRVFLARQLTPYWSFGCSMKHQEEITKTKRDDRTVKSDRLRPFALHLPFRSVSCTYGDRTIGIFALWSFLDPLDWWRALWLAHFRFFWNFFGIFCSFRRFAVHGWVKRKSFRCAVDWFVRNLSRLSFWTIWQGNVGPRMILEMAQGSKKSQTKAWNLIKTLLHENLWRIWPKKA